MNEEVLNKKLAEWAGFRLVETEHPMRKGLWYDYPIPSSDGDTNGYLPDFTQSLDACFKWLVPKLIEQNCYIQLNTGDNWLVEIWERAVVGRKTHHTAEAETPALALCKAIEKLIDGGVDGS